MKNSTNKSSRLAIGVAAASTLVLMLLVVAALVANGRMIGDLVLFLLIGFIKPAALIGLGVVAYRYYKRPSRFVQLSPPFTPVTSRS